MKYKRKHNKKGNQKWTLHLPIVSLLLVIILIVFLSGYRDTWLYNWSNINPQIKDTVKSIHKYHFLPSEKVKKSGERLLQYNRIKWFVNNANEYELNKLTNYPSGVIKAITYKTLINRQVDNAFEIIVKAINDTTHFVYVDFGVYGYDECMIGEYIIRYVFNLNYVKFPPYPEYVKYISNRLTENQIKYILDLYMERRLLRSHYLSNFYKNIE